MRVTAAIATLAAVTASCSEPSPPARAQRPLLGGDVVSGADPAVVAILRADGDICCTGTLVSPTVVLTAAHCLEDSLCGDAHDLTVYVGDDLGAPGGFRLGIQRAQRHPEWSGSIDRGRDLALLLLSFSVAPSLAAPLNTAPVEPLVGQPYRVAGFGVIDRGTGAKDGKKRSGEVTIADVLDEPPDDFILIDDRDTVICFGDSGGPGFVTIGGTEYVAGVHSWTTGNCFGPNGDTRVDLYADDFVLPWIQDNDPACGADGLCAPVGCDADPDCEPCGPDGTCASGCPLPDPDCPTSAIGEICQADSQCESDTCVFWEADPSTHFCTRRCAPGGDDCPSPMTCVDVEPIGSVCYFTGGDTPPGVLGSSCSSAAECGAYLCDEGACVTRCDPAIGLDCPSGFACRCGSDGAQYCFSTASGGDGGGCSATGGDGAHWATSLLALLALLRLRSRRARA